jgi:hypothetical protein
VEHNEINVESNDSLISFQQFADHFSSGPNVLYFWQQYIQKEHHCILHGGIRGLVWRSVFRQRSFQPSQLSELADSKLMLNR